MQHIHIEQDFPAPPQTVFERLTDHVGMEKWVKGLKVVLEKEGVPAPNGLGAVRQITANGIIKLAEEVVLWDEPRQMNYKIIRGLPKDHLGEMRFEEKPDGTTHLDYKIRFAIPWWATGDLLGSVIGGQIESAMRAGLKQIASDLG